MMSSKEIVMLDTDLGIPDMGYTTLFSPNFLKIRRTFGKRYRKEGPCGSGCRGAILELSVKKGDSMCWRTFEMMEEVE